MLISSFWTREVSHVYIWSPNHSLQWPQTIRNVAKKKPIDTAPHCLQRMLLKLQKYDYNIIHKPGKEMILVDRLSRFPSWSENWTIVLHHNIQHVTITNDKFNIIRGATEKDPILYAVYHITLNGWPNRFHEAIHIAHQFWGARHELTIDNGLLLKGDRVCIPSELYQRMLSELLLSSNTTNTTQRWTRKPMARPCSRLLSTQHRLPSHHRHIH